MKKRSEAAYPYSPPPPRNSAGSFWGCLLGLLVTAGILTALALSVNTAIDSVRNGSGVDVAAMKASTVKVFNETGLGSGVVISPHRVLTAAHVTRGNDAMQIQMPDGTVRIGHVVWEGKGVAPQHDIAMIDVDTSGARPAHLRCDPLKAGDVVYSYGFPMGIRDVLTKGIVANPEGIPSYAFVDDDFLKHVVPAGIVLLNLTIIPGNSGGGVWDQAGNLVGLADLMVFPDLTAMVSTSGDICEALNK